MDERQLTALDGRRRDLLDMETRRPDAIEHCADTLTPFGVTRPGVVTQGRGMARNYNLHVLTLAQVASLLRVEGSWPGSISLSAGWYRARARPWNEFIADPMLRLERGGPEFLGTVTERLYGLGAGAVYSPALYPTSTDVWRRAGFEDHVSLEVMERPLSGVVNTAAATEVSLQARPDWDQILAVDRLAFEGFWGMSRLGLREAHRTNTTTAVLVISHDRRLSGYAIVGAQWATVYLHRIAVRPEETGRGLGHALLAAAMNWGSRSGGRTMVLNVRPENQMAKRLYERMGFSHTTTALQVLRHRELLN
jgi:ribosomal protein S18 acetylase RimI-like enzyme